MTEDTLIVHATHEAGVKFGGIGAVLEGLLGSRSYNAHVGRTILVGPFDAQDETQMARLTSSRTGLEIAYSSLHHMERVEPELAAAFAVIEREFGVDVLYGRRAFGPAQHEVILVEGSSVDRDRVNHFKGRLYDRFGLQSDRYELDAEYRYYVDVAEPSWLALQALTGDGALRDKFIVAHEFMGLPLVLAGLVYGASEYRNIFYAHEVATVRPLVERNLGYDTRFYAVMDSAQQAGLSLEDVFGDQSQFFKHALVTLAVHCDGLFAVGDRVAEELRFLGRQFAQRDIDLVYNGVPSLQIELDEKTSSKRKLQQYAANLLGYRPDLVFTHITRLIPSKGLWRDVRVLEYMDDALAREGRRAVLFVLATTIPSGRSATDTHRMEREYGWPVTHREGAPDLVSHEIPFYHLIEAFNRRARSCQIVLVNQFGWSHELCGKRMPAEMEFMDIRKGTDLEFGQSIYEPFGIAQLETLTFGALCVLSSSCGGVGFVQRTRRNVTKTSVLIADYLSSASDRRGDSVEQSLQIGQSIREEIEAREAARIARQILDRLPRSDDEQRDTLAEGYELSQAMSWDVVAKEYFLPGLRRAAGR